MRRLFAITAVTTAALGLLAPAAGASTASGKGGWVPYRTQPITDTGICPFTIQGAILKDGEETKIAATYPDGTTKVQLFRGPLVIKFTNTSTGRSVVRDVSGDAHIRYKKDKSQKWRLDGGLSVRIRSGDAFPVGDYIMHGHFTFAIAPDGTRSFPHPPRHIENLCDTLA